MKAINAHPSYSLSLLFPATFVIVSFVSRAKHTHSQPPFIFCLSWPAFSFNYFFYLFPSFLLTDRPNERESSRVASFSLRDRSSIFFSFLFYRTGFFSRRRFSLERQSQSLTTRGLSHHGTDKKTRTFGRLV